MPNIRKAVKSDFDFIAEAIIESEKSGSNIFPYGVLFDVSEMEFKGVLQQIFEEEIEGQPWDYNSWYILENDANETAAALCTWQEGSAGMSSDLLKTQSLGFVLGEKWHNNTDKLEVVSRVNIPRKNGTWQLEHLYTLENHRGNGYMNQLIEFASEGKSSEIQLIENNVAAKKLYEKCGFSLEIKQCEPQIERLQLLAGPCKIKMIKNG
jgi:ribosomal protein S18 acetylase RimI-like enzyme